MRLFQIKIDEINDYAWTENHGDYHEKYAKEREEGAIKVQAQTDKLLGLGVNQDKSVPTVITEKQMTGLVVSGIKFELVREIPTDEDDPTDLNGVMRKFNRMAAKLMSLPGLQRNDDKHDCQNKLVHVHMPGQALATYNEVQLLENVCTDALQQSLDDGWRVIAACPQPDARRPDYILGRYRPDRDSSSSHHASRGVRE